LNGLLQLLNVHIVALPLLLILSLLDLGRPRATGDSRCDHFSALSSRARRIASREKFLVEHAWWLVRFAAGVHSLSTFTFTVTITLALTFSINGEHKERTSVALLK
jgi:hypothetical protein